MARDKYPCPRCGSVKGYVSNLLGVQFYDSNGNKTATELDKEGKSVTCLVCGHWFSKTKLFSQEYKTYMQSSNKSMQKK